MMQCNGADHKPERAGMHTYPFMKRVRVVGGTTERISCQRSAPDSVGIMTSAEQGSRTAGLQHRSSDVLW